jgi:hypothetical protein
MKKLFFFSIFSVTAAAGYAQEIKPNTLAVKQDYLQKSKKQKTAAWILLGGGTTAGTIGLFMVFKEAAKVTTPAVLLPGQPKPDEAKANGGGILMIAGGAAIIGSIPLFTAASKNKKKAFAVSFKNIQVIQKNSFVYTAAPSVSLTISL